MVDFNTIAKIHAGISNRQAEMERYIIDIKDLTHPLAKQTLLEYEQELDKIKADKADFLILTTTNPLEAIKKYTDEYVFPNVRIREELKKL